MLYLGECSYGVKPLTFAAAEGVAGAQSDVVLSITSMLMQCCTHLSESSGDGKPLAFAAAEGVAGAPLEAS